MKIALSFMGIWFDSALTTCVDINGTKLVLNKPKINPAIDNLVNNPFVFCATIEYLRSIYTSASISA